MTSSPTLLRRGGALFAAVLAAGCGPPTELVQLVTSERAPLLPEAEDDEAALTALPTGSVLAVGKRVARLRWRGRLDGIDSQRDGDVHEMRRNAGEHAFGFLADLGPPVKLPTAAWLCAQMQSPAACPDRLRRIQIDGALLAYDPCALGACRVALLRGRTVDAITISGLVELRLAMVDGVRVALAQARWVRGPRWTGATTHVVELAPRLGRSLQIETEEVDARTPPAVQRFGQLTVEGGALVFRGNRRVVSPEQGAVLHEEAIRETYHLARPR